MKDYAEKVAEKLREKTGKDAYVQTIMKNGVERVSVVIPEGRLNPTIYVEEFKAHNVSPADAADRVIELRKEMPTPDIDIENITEWDKAKGLVIACVVGTKQNEKDLANIPHMDVEGSEGTLAYIYRVIMNDEASAKVNNSMLEMWGVELQELHEIAMKNTMEQREVVIDGIIDTLIGIYDSTELVNMNIPLELLQELKETDPMTIVSCKQRLYGFGAVLYPHTIEMLTAMYPGKIIYILPSSVHESIAIPADEDEELEQVMCLAEMVKSVNGEVIHDEDKLVDAVYAIEDGKFRLAYSKIK